LLSAYRKDDYADSIGFVRQLGTILEQYSPHVIEAVTSPLTGLQRRYKFPPSIAEVVAACDEEAARLRRLAELQALRRAPRVYERMDTPGRRANVFVPPDAPQYAAMVEMAQTGDPAEWRTDGMRAGIWVSRGWLL
jgi:hypothetical protein